MEELYTSDFGSVESYIDQCAWKLSQLQLPGWYINPLLKGVFSSCTAWDELVSQYPLTVARGLDSVLSSSTPPTIDFFKSLEGASETTKQWGVYAMVLEKPGSPPDSPPKLYIGSGTAKTDRISRRIREYHSGTAQFSRHTKIALAKGYKISSIGLLFSIDLPTTGNIYRHRGRILLLEAVFTIIFCACFKTIMDDVYIADFFLWQRNEINWEPLCSHLSLAEGVNGDMQLSEEEVRLAEKARTARRAGNRKRKRERESGKFRCDDCDLNFASQYHLDRHLRSKSHLDAVKNGDEVENESPAAERVEEREFVAAIHHKKHHCAPCDVSFTERYNLTQHEKSAKHLKAIAAAQQQAEEEEEEEEPILLDVNGFRFVFM